MKLDHIPQEDIDISIKKQILFKVSKRDKKGQRWELVEDNLVGLDKAIEVVQSNDREHLAIFTKFKDGNGFYWSSDNPKVFGSRALHDEFYEKLFPKLE